MLGPMPHAGSEFEVVLERLDATSEELRALEAWLSPAEVKRADRFFFQRHRRRYVVARARLRQLLGQRLGVAPQDIALVYGANGKPRLADEAMRFSVSHSGEIALFAFSEAREVGVDIEAVRPIDSADTIAAHILSRGELRAYAAARDKVAAFLRFWTRKEALAKALGDGLSIPLEKLEPSRAPGWRVHSFCPLSGFIAAVACHTGP
jgi:4'-phosphopantetheinyl transferase